MLTYIALVLGAVGILMAWNANRKNKDLKERIAQVNSRVYHLRREIHETQEATAQERTALKFEILKLQGDLKITPEMQIGEITAIHPQASQVLAGFHLGGCSSCVVDDTQSLAEAAAVNGRDVEPILVALNTLVTEGQNGGMVPPEPLKSPNVELQM
jgi:hybrid cluster-associated redox disulfide protein